MAGWDAQKGYTCNESRVSCAVMTDLRNAEAGHATALGRTRVGNAPCSWGIMGGFVFNPMPTYRQVLDEIAATGFTGTELGDWGFMPDDPLTLRGDIESRRLAMIGAFTPVRLTDSVAHAGSEAAALRAARLLRALCDEPFRSSGPFVILAEASTPERIGVAGRASAADRLKDDEWRALAAGAERIAVRVRDETGLPTVFHHHSGTSVETLWETSRFLDMTDADVIGLCYDTGHFAYAGTDALEALRLFRKRVWHVHFKDFRPDVADRARRERLNYNEAVASGLFCGLGSGAIDFPAILDELLAMRYEGWIVVEDEMPPGSCVPFENAERDRAYLRRLGL